MTVATFASLAPASYREIVRRALAEDVRWGDITTEVVIPTQLQTAGALVLGTRCVLQAARSARRGGDGSTWRGAMRGGDGGGASAW